MDLIAGIAGGLTQIIIGHPFDTIKTRLQNNLSWKSFNILSYYKGGLSQVPYSITKNSIIFTSFSYSYNYTNSLIISGLTAGIVASPTQIFFDTIKIKKQTNKKLNLKSFTSNYGKLATISKESLGMSVYFYTYHKVHPNQHLS